MSDSPEQASEGGLTDALIQSTLIQLVQKDVKEKIILGGEGESFVTIVSKTGNQIELNMEFEKVDLIFGLYGEAFPFPPEGGEVEFFRNIMRYITGITREELVSIRYLKGSLMGLNKQPVGAIIPRSEMGKFEKEKKFEALSWNNSLNK